MIIVGVDKVRIHGNRKLASSRAVRVVDLKTHDVVQMVILCLIHSLHSYIHLNFKIGELLVHFFFQIPPLPKIF